MLSWKEKRKQIKRKRKEVGLTQQELAKMSGVSQSQIAKIEGQKTRRTPSYRTVEKITGALSRAETDRSKAGEIMSSPVKDVGPKDKMKDAVKTMLKNGFSQLPVVSEGRPVGSISETRVFKLREEHEAEEVREMGVSEVMEPSFPTVNLQEPVDSVRELLRNNRAVLVEKNSEIKGIVDRADFLKLE